MLVNYARTLIQNVIGFAFPDMFTSPNEERKTLIELARRYRKGEQPPSLKIKPGQTDDNIIVNFIGLVVDRSISLLYGGGVTFDLPGEGKTPEDEYLELVWKLNKKLEFFFDIGDYGASSGTCVVQFSNDSIFHENKYYPEVFATDSKYLTIQTKTENHKHITGYVLEFQILLDNRPRNRRRTIRPLSMLEEVEGGEAVAVTRWEIVDEIQDQNGQWEQYMPPVLWNYDWAPIYAWKNLPQAGTPYGRPDITPDVIHLQNKVNLAWSNYNKVSRLQAFQRIWGRFLGSKVSAVSVGADQAINIANEKGHMEAIPPGDMSGVSLFANELRDLLFTIARSADPATIKDKVGDITNFGLRVLYKDVLDKLDTKRALYGEAFLEINRRLLILGEQANTDPGTVEWGEALPSEVNEEIAGYSFDLDHEIASRQTIRERRGYDEEVETERLETEQKKADERQDNIGAAMLKNFSTDSVQQRKLMSKQKIDPNTKKGVNV